MITYVQTAKIFAVLQGILNREICKVLTSENQNFSLGGKCSKLRFPSIRQCAQLDAGDLGAYSGSDIVCLDFST